MAQFTIKWPNGAELSYEGDDVEFSEVVELLEQDTPPLLRGAGAVGAQAGGGTPSDPPPPSRRGRFDFAAIQARFEEVQARTDVERVTVLAQVAVDAGIPGLDLDTAEELYRELGLRMPGNWRSTFSNAQTRGYLRNLGKGLWRPTAAGENFARRGERRPSASRRRRQREGAAS